MECCMLGGCNTSIKKRKISKTVSGTSDRGLIHQLYLLCLHPMIFISKYNHMFLFVFCKLLICVAIMSNNWYIIFHLIFLLTGEQRQWQKPQNPEQCTMSPTGIIWLFQWLNMIYNKAFIKQFIKWLITCTLKLCLWKQIVCKWNFFRISKILEISGFVILFTNGSLCHILCTNLFLFCFDFEFPFYNHILTFLKKFSNVPIL